MKVAAFGFLFLLLTHVAPACVNITGTKYNGGPVTYGGNRLALMLQRDMAKDMHSKGIEMERDLRKSTNFNDRSDYSVALMYLGRAPEAVELLKRLEAEKPGEYFVAANLGTAYELADNKVEALKWIQEGIRRNPESHDGTEWLHVKILEARIAQQKDSNYFKIHTVLDLRPEEFNSEITTIAGRAYTPAELRGAIQYQLSERMKFVKPPDPAVAALLFDLAAIEARSGTLESAEAILNLAETYGYPTERLQPLRQLYDHRIALRKTKQYAFYTILVVLGVYALWFLHKKKIFFLSRRECERARAAKRAARAG